MKLNAKELFPSVWVAFLCAAVFAFYIPVVSYLGNVDIYSFTLWQLIMGMQGFFGIVFVLVFAVITAAEYVISRTKIKGLQALHTSYRNKFSISVLHVFFLLILLLIWAEGTLLNKGLPKITGEANPFSAVPRLILSSAVWVLVLGAGLVFWRKLGKHFMGLFLSICLLFSLGVADMAIFSGQSRAQDISEHAQDVMDQSTFSTESNVLVLVLDAMSTALVQDYLDAYPETEQELDGFVMFPNHMQPADNTQFSLTSTFRGAVYTGGQVRKFQNGSLTDEGTLPHRFASAGYDVYISSTLAGYNSIQMPEGSRPAANRSSGHLLVSPQLYGQMLIRHAPYALKNALANQVGILTNVNRTDAVYDGNFLGLVNLYNMSFDEMTYQTMTQSIRKASGARPTFHVRHVHGAHVPYRVDSAGNPLPESERFSLAGLWEQSQWTWRRVRDLLTEMKQRGIYDATTIVLMGDHGDRLSSEGRSHEPYTNFASLLIKPAGGKGALQISDAPTHGTYLANILPAIHLENKSLDSVTQHLPDTRFKLVDNNGTTLYEYEGADVTQLREVSQTEVKQEFLPNILQEGIVYSLSNLNEGQEAVAYPLALQNANFTNGWGVRAMADVMECSFLVGRTIPQKPDVMLVVSTTALVGAEAAFEPYELIIRDQVSGKEYFFTVFETTQNITLKGVSISDEASLQLAFEMKPLPDPEVLQVLLHAIQINATK